MQCFNDKQLKLYMHGAIPAKDIPGAAEHIRSCPACREKLAALTEYTRAAWSIGDAVLAAEGCPEYEELSAYVDETLSHETHQWIERHIGMCEYCSRDVETLQAARSRASLAPQITVRPGFYAKPRQHWNVFSWKSVTATAAGIAAITAIFIMSQTGPIANNPIVAKQHVKVDRVAVVPNNVSVKARPDIKLNTSANSSVKSGPKAGSLVKEHITHHARPVAAPMTPEKPEFVAEVHDGGITVGKSGGNIIIKTNGKDLEAQIAALVEKKVKTGSAPSSFQIAMAPTGALRGYWDPIDLKMSPAPDMIVEPDAAFSWEPVDGASKYRVEIYKYDGTPVVHAETEDPSYQPEKKLPGGFYKWRIMARRGEMAEWESSRAAGFRVLTNKETSLINHAEREYHNSHLVLGTVYESVGLNKQAVDEFQALRNENPKSEIATKMLNGAQSKLANH
ncbi:MAG: zf-HC2 domain-containing protein [Armatimonadota bacterium]